MRPPEKDNLVQNPLSKNVLASDRWRWILPDATKTALVEETLSALRSPKAPVVTIIKSNPARTIFSVAGDIPVVVKKYNVRTAGECLKHIVAPSKAAAAFHGYRLCAGKAIPVSQVLAWGERRRGALLRRSCLVERRIENAISLGEHIHDHFLESSAGRRAALMRSVGALLAEFHAAGLSHPDFHPGNILLRWKDSGEPELFVVDLHPVRRLRLLRSRRRVQDLAKLYHSLCPVVQEEDLKELLAAYLRAAGPFRVPEARIARLAGKLERTRLRSRTRRCVKRSSRFTKERFNGLTVYRRRDWSREDLQAALREHEEARDLRDARLVKQSHKSWVTVVPSSDRRYSERLVVKEPQLRLPFSGRRGTVNILRMRRAWIAANAFAVRGFSVPQHLALVEKRVLRFPRRAWLICRYQENATDLDRYLESHPDLPSGFLDQLAQTISRLFRSGIYHSDLSGKNILITERPKDQWEFHFLDLESVTLWRRLTARRKCNNIRQIDRSLKAWCDPLQRELFLDKVSPTGMLGERPGAR
jgi:tRNA A-37 threonylcarbamoyl transferase component Bud32